MNAIVSEKQRNYVSSIHSLDKLKSKRHNIFLKISLEYMSCTNGVFVIGVIGSPNCTSKEWITEQITNNYNTNNNTAHDRLNDPFSWMRKISDIHNDICHQKVNYPSLSIHIFIYYS